MSAVSKTNEAGPLLNVMVALLVIGGRLLLELPSPNCSGPPQTVMLVTLLSFPSSTSLPPGRLATSPLPLTAALIVAVIPLATVIDAPAGSDRVPAPSIV